MFNVIIFTAIEIARHGADRQPADEVGLLLSHSWRTWFLFALMELTYLRALLHHRGHGRCPRY